MICLLPRKLDNLRLTDFFRPDLVSCLEHNSDVGKTPPDASGHSFSIFSLSAIVFGALKNILNNQP